MRRIGGAREVGLLRHGSIPDYYPQFDTDGGLSKKQKLSVLTDYEVIPLVNAGPGGGYDKQLRTPNRRRALVALALSDEGMRNCQSIIDKVSKHRNVGYILFRHSNKGPSADYPCNGAYLDAQKVSYGHASIPLSKHFSGGNVTTHYQRYFFTLFLS